MSDEENKCISSDCDMNNPIASAIWWSNYKKNNPELFQEPEYQAFDEKNGPIWLQILCCFAIIPLIPIGLIILFLIAFIDELSKQKYWKKENILNMYSNRFKKLDK